MRQKINVIIHEPILVTNGVDKVFKTRITHPNLEGELSFIHGENGREDILKIISNSIVEDLSEMIDLVKKFNQG